MMMMTMMLDHSDDDDDNDHSDDADKSNPKSGLLVCLTLKGFKAPKPYKGGVFLVFRFYQGKSSDLVKASWVG